MEPKNNALLSLLPEEISDSLKLTPAYQGKQIFNALHRNLAVSFSEISTLPKQTRDLLAENCDIAPSEEKKSLKDKEGTLKLLLGLAGGLAVETVLLRDSAGRTTACLSSQIGCAMGCTFCKTATMGLKRNLTSSEIVDQFRHLVRREGPVNNVVFMGMGETLANYDNLKAAIRILHHPEAYNLGYRRITISTAGFIPGIKRLSEEGPPVGLAVSLNSADPELRSRIMPINRSYPLSDLREALTTYQSATGQRITFEWVLLSGINSGDKEIEHLKRFLGNLKAAVNLIPWNRVPGLPYREPERSEIEDFYGKLLTLGIPVTRRFRRGKRINGACGQLAT